MSVTMNRFSIAFVIICLKLCFCQEINLQSTCFGKTCTSCVKDHECVWCSQEGLNSSVNRCQEKTSLSSNWCQGRINIWDWHRTKNSSCVCETPGYYEYEESSPKCHGFGDYKCGICYCESGHHGRFCECESFPPAFSIAPGYNEEDSCKQDNSPLVCSGRGQCICGYCQCNELPNPDERISGHFCECDNFSCDRHNGSLCSGSDHGTCFCGQCICKTNWTGSDCSCLDSNDYCVSPSNGKICSGNGKCVCGKCICDTGNGKYCETVSIFKTFFKYDISFNISKLPSFNFSLSNRYSRKIN